METPETDARRRGSIAVIVRDGQLLVVRRSRSVVAPGKLCFPGGGIRAGESEAEALVRELREELGVAVVPIRRLWQSRTPWNVDLFWWAAGLERDAVLTPDPAEVEAYYWMAPRQLLAEPDLLKSNREFLRRLLRGDWAADGFSFGG